jgi:protein TonB
MAAVSITPLVISAFKTPDVVKGWELPPPMVIPDEPVDNPPVTITPVKPATAPDTKTFDSTVPTPSRNAQDNVRMILFRMML